MTKAAAAERRASWGIFLLAAVVRLGYALRQGLPVPIVGDAVEYHAYARHLVETGRYTGPAGELATRMPGYPLFLAALRLVYGGSVGCVVVAQCLIGALTCVLLYKLVVRLLPAPWPLLAGLFAACYLDLVAPCASLVSECLYGFFLIASAWALYHEDWTPLKRAAAFGALSGALYLVRPEPLPYILATCILLPRLFARFGRREAAAALTAFALIAGLWVGRNFAVFGRLLPASSVGKNVAYVTLYLPVHQLGLAPEPRHAAPAGLSELEREADFSSEWKKLLSRLTPAQIVRAYAFNLLSILYPFLPEYDWSYIFLLPFGLWGLFVAARRKALRPFAAAVLCSIGVFVFFGGPASRYRQGISPFIVLLAGGCFPPPNGGATSRWRRWS